MTPPIGVGQGMRQGTGAGGRGELLLFARDLCALSGDRAANSWAPRRTEGCPAGLPVPVRIRGMTMVRKIAPAAVVAVLLAASRLAALAQGTGAPAAGAKPAPGQAQDQAKDPVVATVNGTAIHRSDVEQAREQLPSQYQSFPFE